MLSDECTYILTGKVNSYMKYRLGMYWSGSHWIATWFCSVDPLTPLCQCFSGTGTFRFESIYSCLQCLHLKFVKMHLECYWSI